MPFFLLIDAYFKPKCTFTAVKFPATNSTLDTKSNTQATFEYPACTFDYSNATNSLRVAAGPHTFATLKKSLGGCFQVVILKAATATHHLLAAVEHLELKRNRFIADQSKEFVSSCGSC